MNCWDEDGYPTEEFLDSIRNWSWKNSFVDLMAHIKPYWKYSDFGYWTQDGDTYSISTGGWSGNEDIIRALKENGIFWSICWYSSRRGGHYEFEIKELKE